MAAVREEPLRSRYGRSADQRADRGLKVVGAVLGVALIGLIGWFGYHYVVDRSVSGELIKFKRVSATEVEAHLEVRKDRDATGSCTLRSLAESGAEVGRLDVRFGAGETRIDRVVTVRTTSSATSTELLGCTSD
ncbi:DUF4307 domain-containing protein [Streptomyces scopuliridis]|uniref:Membrane protein n=2 Tax=Streptomyces scopuliridis TaxID=452529 RepID=A0A2T7T970_9ACTN|nr:DUF4307 domain-containing protein [Streptomyces scopuliridis]PVE11720.1 membrane protein [Streptomyces scopuliridis RB72]WSB33767.1 DUF4307 domain-containing protein [Streptomyces scopuliridis]WSB98040.1 DUF4307 domain-containing protein [Streptomyces scopuliridis]WSC08258.1 DUF4307 domain-containing protein [Streptomyces scopuliridis]